MKMASNPYKLNSGMRCVKYMLFVINALFMLTAILLILVGTTIHSIYTDFQSIVDLSDFTSPTTLLVVIGCILLLVSLFGCIGAVKESTLLINVYGLLLFVIFILEFGAAIAAFVLQGNVKHLVAENMKESLYKYEGNEYVKNGVDFMQQELFCCGVNGPKDWEKVFNKTENSVPDSCRYQCDGNEDQFKDGCLKQLTFIIAQSTMLLATGASTVAFVQILGVICAFMLAKTIRRTKSMRAAKRWQLQQSLGILENNKKNCDPEYTQLGKSAIN